MNKERNLDISFHYYINTENFKSFVIRHLRDIQVSEIVFRCGEKMNELIYNGSPVRSDISHTFISLNSLRFTQRKYRHPESGCSRDLSIFARIITRSSSQSRGIYRFHFRERGGSRSSRDAQNALRMPARSRDR